MIRMRLKRSAYMLLTAGLCIFGGMTAYGDTEADQNPAVYVSGTTINGVNVSGLTPEEAKGHMESFLAGSYELMIIDSSQREARISYQDIGLKAEITGNLDEVLAKENEQGRQSGPSAGNTFTVTMNITYDENALTDRLKGLKCMTSGVKETRDAYISSYEEGKEFTIIPEVRGNNVNWERLTAAVKEALQSGRRTLNLYETGCYEKVNVASDNEELIRLRDTMNRFRTTAVSYRFGEETEELAGGEIASWIKGSEGTEILFDREKAAAYVKTLADKYDTAGKERIFHTTAGAETAVTGPYGWKIDVEAETDALLQAIRTGENTDREPVYAQTAAKRGEDEYGGTYVEIDLTNQHVYLYQEGNLVLETPCVTGNVSKGWTTPPGIYGLYYKQRDRVLKGEDYATPVSYWMPFNGGIGLHDANWRGQFGGGIYQTSGSHGCINLPPQKAAQIYEIVYKNIPVICYN